MTFRRFSDAIAQKAHRRFQEPRGTHLFRKIGIRRTGDPDEFAARLEHSQRLLESISALRIQYHVVVLQDGRKVVFLVIDDDIRTELLHPSGIPRARCRCDSRAHMLRQLNGKGANAARASMYEHFLPFHELPFFDQRLPGGQAHQWDRSRFFHGECHGLESHAVFLERDEFGESADAILVRSRIDFIARFESQYARSDADNNPGQIVAQNQWKTIRQNELELSVSDFAIERVHAGGVNLDQYVVLAQFGDGHIAGSYAILAPISIDDECLHHGSLSVSHCIKLFRRAQHSHALTSTAAL